MINRKALLEQLICCPKNIEEVMMQLNQYPFDSDEELTVINKNIIHNVLSRYLSGDLKEYQIEDWANHIEGRDDIGFEFDDIQRIIFELANPLLYEKLSINRAKSILLSLQ